MARTDERHHALSNSDVQRALKEAREIDDASTKWRARANLAREAATRRDALAELYYISYRRWPGEAHTLALHDLWLDAAAAADDTDDLPGADVADRADVTRVHVARNLGHSQRRSVQLALAATADAEKAHDILSDRDRPDGGLRKAIADARVVDAWRDRLRAIEGMISRGEVSNSAEEADEANAYRDRLRRLIAPHDRR